MQFNTTMLPEDAHVWAACQEDGTIIISKVFASFDEAYDDYIENMQTLVHCGEDLSTYKWRGPVKVSSLAQHLATHYQFSAEV